MYINFLKWSFYTRLKRNFVNLKIFKNLNEKWIIQIFILYQIFKLSMTLIIVNLILNNNFILTNNQYLNELINFFAKNKINFLILFLFYILIFIYQNSIKSVNIGKNSMFKDWMLANTTIKRSNLNLLMYLDFILYKSLDIATFQIPIVIMTLWYLNYYVYNIIVISILYGISIVLLLTLGSLIYSLNLSLRTDSNSVKKIIVLNIFKIIICIAMFNPIGRHLSTWVGDFPLTSKIVPLSDFHNWINTFNVKYIESFLDIFYEFIERFNYLNQLNLIIVLSTLILILSISIMLISKFTAISKFKDYCPIEEINSKTKKSGMIITQLKIFIRSKFILLKSNNLAGNIFYWCLVGLYSGLFRSIEFKSKMYYFLIVSYIFYSSYILIISTFENLSAKFCIDGEGKQIYWWVNSNLFKLFKYKQVVFGLYITVIMGVTNFIIFGMVETNFIFLVVVFITQLIFSITLFNILSIPSIVFSHFDYVNIEEINDFADRKNLFDSINVVIVIVFIPMLVLPTASFMTDYITSIPIYIAMQFAFLCVVLILLNLGIEKLIKNKLNSKSYIYSIFEI